MSNCILAFPDRSLNASFSGGSWNTAYPLTNLNLPDLAYKTRSVDALAASTKFDFYMGASYKLRVLAIIGHNISVGATIRCRFSTVSDFATNVYDSGTIDVYPNYYDTTSLDWGHPVLTANKPSTADAIAMRYPIFFVAPAAVTGAYGRVEITDTTNVDGYVEISRCFVSPGLQPTVNMNIGASSGLIGRTKVESSLNGTEYFQKIYPIRVQSFSLSTLSQEVGIGQFLEAQRYLDIDTDVFFVHDPAAVSMSVRLQSFMGKLRQLASYEFTDYTRGDIAFEIKETV